MTNEEHKQKKSPPILLEIALQWAWTSSLCATPLIYGWLRHGIEPGPYAWSSVLIAGFIAANLVTTERK